MGAHWGIFISRLAIFLAALVLLVLSQRYWLRRTWRLAGRARRPFPRALLRGAVLAMLALVCVAVVGGILGTRHRVFVGASWLKVLAGLWLFSSLLAFLGVKAVRGVEWLWTRLSLARRARSAEPEAASAAREPVPNPSRRYFFQTAGFLAGAVPFIGAVYGFAAERLRYQLYRVELPIPGLPAALDGLRIAQLSDIHIGGYMPREQVRRAVDMANELGADLAVVTGDFITGASDPLADCVAELARLRAPLGVWGCNGNHEIYADAEDAAAELFHRAGMRILRRENVELRWRGQAFNLLGVDYQRARTPSGRRLEMLPGLEPLVRRDVPNILLSHNPNAFPRAAELGIELTLAGHTHGGQVQVEILERRWSPARFITPFVAGLYRRPLGLAPAPPHGAAGDDSSSSSAFPSVVSPSAHEPPVTAEEPRASLLYVNRGLGTIGAPVRLGVPPEITLLVLRRA